MDGIEEINLVRASQQGDREAFSRLVQQHGRIVFATCLSSMGHAHLDMDGLGKALGALPESLCQAIWLYYMDGRSTASVAQALGISPDGVMTRLSRARRMLRERLRAEGETL